MVDGEHQLLEQQIADAARRERLYADVLQRRRAVLGRLRNRRNRLLREKVLLERRIREMQASRSWRLTAPLRRFMRLLRRRGGTTESGSGGIDEPR